MERKDTWSKSDDTILAETVLKHIREGSTQLKAFEEVSNILGRTPAACGFRWNSEVRKHFKKEIAEVKKIKKSKPKHPKVLENKTVKNDLLLPQFDNLQNLIKNLKMTFKNMENEIKKLRSEIQNKDKKIKQLQNQRLKTMAQDDFQTFLKILQNARKLGMLEITQKKEKVV